jgi:hypothetical protein
MAPRFERTVSIHDVDVNAKSGAGELDRNPLRPTQASHERLGACSFVL